MKIYISLPWKDYNERAHVQKRQEIMKALEFHFKTKIDFLCYCDVYNSDNKYAMERHSSTDYIKESDKVVFLAPSDADSQLSKDEMIIVENLFPEKLISPHEIDEYILDYYRAKCKSFATVKASEFKKNLLSVSDNASIYVNINDEEFPIKDVIVNSDDDKMIISL